MNADSTYRNEIPLQPGFVLHCIEASHVLPLHIHLAVVDVRVLRGGVISPDDHILHTLWRNATTHCHLEDTLHNYVITVIFSKADKTNVESIHGLFSDVMLLQN